MLGSGRRVARDAAVYLAADGLVKALNLILIPLLARHLTVEQYGTLSMAEVVRVFLSATFLNVLSQTVLPLYFRFDSESSRRSFLGSVFVSSSAALLAVGVALELAGPKLFSIFFAGMPYAPFGRVVVWASILATIESGMTLSVMRAQGRVLAYTALLLVPALLRFGLTCFLLFVRHGGVLEVLLAHLYTSVVVLVPCLVLGLRQVHLSLRGADVRRFAAFSSPILVHQLAAWGLNMVDRPLVNHFAGLAQLGIYTFGYQVAMVLAMLSASLGSAWMPHFFALAKKGHHQAQASRLATYVTGVTVVACVLLIVCAKPAVEILAPPAYGRAAHIVPYIAVGYLLLGFGQLPRAALLFAGQTSVIAVTTLVAVLLNVGLNWLTIPRFGITAAAVNTALCFLVTAALSVLAARKTEVLRYEVARLAKLAFVAAGAGVAASFLSLGNPRADLVVRPLSCLVAFAGGLRLVGFFTSEESAMVGRGVSRMGQNLRRMVLKNA